MGYLITFFHTLYQSGYTVIAPNEVMAKTFISQLESNKSAIAMGHVNSIYVPKDPSPEECVEITDIKEYHDTISTHGMVKVCRSKLSPEIEVLATPMLMTIYEERAMDIVHSLSGGTGLLFLKSLKYLRGNFIQRNTIHDIETCVLTALENIGRGEIDFVKLSTDILFHSPLFAYMGIGVDLQWPPK